MWCYSIRVLLEKIDSSRTCMIFVNLIWLTKIEVAIILIKSKAMFFGGWLVSFQRFQDSQHVKYKTNKKTLGSCFTVFPVRIFQDWHIKMAWWTAIPTMLQKLSLMHTLNSTPENKKIDLHLYAFRAHYRLYCLELVLGAYLKMNSVIP